MFNLVLLLLIRSVCFAWCIALQLPTPNTESMNKEFRQDLEQLQTLGRSRDLNRFETVANQSINKWRSSNLNRYFELTHSATRLLRSEDFGDQERQRRLAHSLATEVLAYGNEIPLEIELDLLVLLQGEPIASSNRREMASFWLHGWQRLEEENSKPFDFSKLPEANAAPPAETGLPRGIDPSAVKDSVLRAQYERAIAQAAETAEQFRFRYRLRQLEPSFSRITEGYLVKAYSQPPANLDELTNLLSTYISDNAVRTTILDRVRLGGAK